MQEYGTFSTILQGEKGLSKHEFDESGMACTTVEEIAHCRYCGGSGHRKSPGTEVPSLRCPALVSEMHVLQEERTLSKSLQEERKRLKKIMSEYEDKNVWNLDESGLFGVK